MPYEKGFIDRDILDTRRAFADDNVLDTVNHQEGLAMRNPFP